MGTRSKFLISRLWIRTLCVRVHSYTTIEATVWGEGGGGVCSGHFLSILNLHVV